MKTLNFYILRKIIASIGGLSMIFIGAIWLTQSLRFLELIVNHNVSLKGYLGLVVYLLPDLIATTLPICVLIAGVQVYQKFVADNELAVMRSVGLSNVQIAMPMITVGAIATVLTLMINLYIIPRAFQSFRAKEYTIRNELSSSVISEGAFNVIKGVTVYIRERRDSGEMQGVFIHHEQEVDSNGVITPAYTVFAEKGQFIHDEKGVSLYLKNGHRQEKDSNQHLSFLHFEEFRYDLSALMQNDGERSVKPYERTLRELLNPEAFAADLCVKNRMIVEGHQRLLTPFQSLLNALILAGALLYGDLRRRRRKHKVITALVLSLVTQGLLISILNAATTNMGLLYVCYGVMAVLMLSFFFLLYGYQLPAHFKKLLLKFFQKGAA